jgi:DNA (cytosine-5)-methyltransferase 1
MKSKNRRGAPRVPRLISLYTGAGGLDYGFEAAGFQTSAAVEIDAECCETLKQNRGWAVFGRSIFDVSTDQLLEAASGKRATIDLVIGGPPCQPFSKSGYWASGDSKRLADPRSGTLGAYMRVVGEVLPKAFLLENVEGLAYEGKNEGLQFVFDMIERINKKTRANYVPSHAVLCAADYGVPQMRNRLFVVAGRDGQKFRFPMPTHASPDAAGDLLQLPRHMTAWDALADIEPDSGEDLAMRGKWADLLPSIPEGENYLWHTERGGGLPLFGWRRRYWSFLLKLSKARPSWTVQAQPGPGTGPFHWENRRLSMRELCRLQTFPDDVSIKGSYRAIHRQVGNAVPSLLAEVLARELRSQIFGLPVLTERPTLMPPDRSPSPPPEPVLAVPRAFTHLVGEHDAHPGTGRGYGALQRSVQREG